MEEIAKALDSMRNGFDASAAKALHEAAKGWAQMSLDNFTGKLLSRAMGISIAVAEFTVELERQGK